MSAATTLPPITNKPFDPADERVFNIKSHTFVFECMFGVEFSGFFAGGAEHITVHLHAQSN